ncbi:hypothetical protein ACFYXM_24220 [Streptomyces sp. NPDC002476]|uniref:hypothetical protein n=1 Tax=Streptomyces sp. NPDC002476 TaxID=3364648 RepID=UPI00367D94E7
MKVRSAFGLRKCTEEDQTEWLAGELCPVELSRERLAEAVVARCCKDRLEPLAPGTVEAVDRRRRGEARPPGSTAPRPGREPPYDPLNREREPPWPQADGFAA